MAGLGIPTWYAKSMEDAAVTCSSAAAGTTVVAAANCPFMLAGIRFANLTTGHEVISIYDGAANASTPQLIDSFSIPYDATATFLNYYQWKPPYPVKIGTTLVVKTTNANAVSAIPLRAEYTL